MVFSKLRKSKISAGNTAGLSKRKQKLVETASAQTLLPSSDPEVLDWQCNVSQSVYNILRCDTPNLYTQQFCNAFGDFIDTHCQSEPEEPECGDVGDVCESNGDCCSGLCNNGTCL